jgi:hypothetical protein
LLEPLQQPLQQPLLEPLQQPNMQPDLQPYPNEDYLYYNITSQDVHTNIKVYACIYSIEQSHIKYYMQNQTNIVLPSFTFIYQEEQQLLQQQGGYIDSMDSGDPLDIAFINKCIEFIPGSEYVGYIPNIAEPTSVFVFLKVHSAPASLVPCISNELYYISKVGNIPVDTTINNMFANNRWLVSESDPFSGYACKLDANGNLVNIQQGDIPDLLDIESVGSYYYFSFVPLSDNQEPLDRYMLFPHDYVCITEELLVEEDDDSNSLYIDGLLVPGKKIFALSLPTQFAKIE